MMKPSPIFRFGVRILTPILLVTSLVICWRGHQLPGGGFVGGLIASVSLLIHALCGDPKETLRLIRIKPESILFIGLVVALSATLWGPALGEMFFKGIWASAPIIDKIGTPVLFDMGVYLIVIGAVCTALFSLMEEIE